jgi:arabinan endo-1,5-alpha-L-arabinosidase
MSKKHTVSSRPVLKRASLSLLGIVGALIVVAAVLVATSAQAGSRSEQKVQASPKKISTPVQTAKAKPVDIQPPPTSTPESPGIVLASSNVFDMPDPFLIVVNGVYYMYMSNAFNDPTGSNVPVLVGTPGHFGPIHDAMPTVPPWAFPSNGGADNIWDPDVVYLDGHYIMYTAPTVRDDPLENPMHCLSVSISNNPGGPFISDGGPLVCQPNLGGDIDADFFVDPNGPRGPKNPYYMVWKSDNNNLPGSGPCTIWAAPMSNDGLTLAGPPVAIFRPTYRWEEPVLEAPQMDMAPNGQLWLFFSSGAGYYTDRYDIGVVACDGIFGGCDGKTAHLMVNSNDQGVAPGEETLYVSPDGSSWLLYNPWHSRIPFEPLRPVEAVRIGWGSAGPYIAEAGQFPQP